MRAHRLAGAIACLALAGGIVHPTVAPGGTGGELSWQPLQSVPGIIDITGPRRDGRYVVTAGGRLSLLNPGSEPTPFARGPDGYLDPSGHEPYIALAPGGRVRGAGCSFERDDVFALDAGAQPGVFRVTVDGRAERFADLPSGTFPSGIGFDTFGRFGGRLLVTGVLGGALGDAATLYGIDCRGRLKPFVEGGPRVEGGIAVAPRSFGRHAGRLVAADEISGRVVAFGANGSSRAIAAPGVPAGYDIGVESVGFVPRRFGPGDAAYLSDRAESGGIFPGTNGLLVLGGKPLKRAGVRHGDLLVATEGGAETVRVRCHPECAVSQVATGPDIAHAEGHIEFGPSP